MKAVQVVPGVWMTQVDSRIVRFWLDENGLHAKQTEAIDGKQIEHREEVLPFSDALAKAEKQLSLL